MPMRGAPLRPSTAGTTRVCVDTIQHGDVQGEVFSPYLEQPIPFGSIAALLAGLEQVADTLDFPQAYVDYRTFGSAHDPRRSAMDQERSLTRFMEEQTFEKKVGQVATFIIQVQFRQNATWQGTITWSEKKQVQRFRSTLEMIKLMDQAVEEAKAAGAYVRWAEEIE